MSPSAWNREHGDQIFYTLGFLDHLERRGVRVINGLKAFRTELSKAAQLSLLDELGLPYPKARVIHRASQAPRRRMACAGPSSSSRTSAAAARASSASIIQRSLPRQPRSHAGTPEGLALGHGFHRAGAGVYPRARSHISCAWRC